jgi:hypothetical protein
MQMCCHANGVSRYCVSIVSKSVTITVKVEFSYDSSYSFLGHTEDICLRADSLQSM